MIGFLSRAERPVIVAGNGIRVAGAVPEFLRVSDAIKAPVLTTWLGMDLIADNHPLFAGRPGAIAPRGANFALQNSDLMLAIGARLDMAFTGYAHDKLARAAVKIIVDVDEAEIRKLKMPIALSVVADAGDFLRELERQLPGKTLPSYGNWLQRCQDWKQRYPIVQKEHRERETGVSVYYFSEIISDALAAEDVVVSGSSGSAIELFLLVFKVKENQRIFHTRGLGAMGFALPASIGACLAAGSAPHDLRGWRRRIPDEHPGARDGPASPVADQIFRAEQRWLRLDPDLAGKLFPSIGRGGQHERAHIARLAESGAGLRTQDGAHRKIRQP